MQAILTVNRTQIFIPASDHRDHNVIIELLVDQVTGRVRWRESALAMAEAGVERFVEFGGKVVGPMIRRSARDVETASVIGMDDIEALAREL